VSAVRLRVGRAAWAAALALCALLAPGARADDDASFTASIDRAEIGLDETVRLDLTLTVSSKGDSPDLQIPPFRDFDVVGRSSSQQVAFAFSNGAPSFKQTTVTSLTLTPHRAGSLTIDAVRVNLRGRTLATQPISVRVLPAGQTPPPRRQNPQQQGGRGQAGNPFGMLDPFSDPDLDPFAGMHQMNARDYTLKAAVDNEHPYVGQQVTWSLWLVAKGSVSSIDKLELPKSDGFWTEEIEAPQQLVGETRLIDGVQMQVYLLRKRALFPLRAGKTAIEPAEVEVISGMGMLFSRASVKRSSQPINLDVQPLPPGAPVGFDPGNIGQWSLSASAEPLAVTVGQPVTFHLSASGRGNLRDLALPKLPAIPGLREYDATTTDKTNIDHGRAGGTRLVEQLLVPERTGELEIPALALDVFDPAAREYKTLKTQALRLTVAAGSGAQGGSQQAAQNLLAAGGLRPIRLKLHRSSPGTPPWMQGWFWPALLAPPLLLLAFLGAERARRMLSSDPNDRRVRQAAGAAKARLRGAEKLLEQRKSGGAGSGEFYAEVSRALSGYLADKQRISTAGLTRDELGRALAERGHSRVTVDKLVALLDACDQARFAPGSESQAAQEAALQRAFAVLAALDGGQKEAA